MPGRRGGKGRGGGGKSFGGRIWAHRGTGTLFPENSILAFQDVNAAVPIETDVRVSSDGVLYLKHDVDFTRTSNDVRAISALTAAQIDAIDIGTLFSSTMSAVRTPTLAAAIAACSRNQEWVLEDKTISLTTSRAIAQFIHDNGLYSRCVLSGALSLANWTIIHNEFPRLQCIGYYATPPGNVNQLKAAGLVGIALDQTVPWWANDVVRELESNGIRVIGYTCEKRIERDRIFAFGASTVVSGQWRYIAELFDVEHQLPFTDNFTRDYLGERWETRGNLETYKVVGQVAARVGYIGSQVALSEGWILNGIKYPSTGTTVITGKYTPRALHADPSRSMDALICCTSDRSPGNGLPVPTDVDGYSMRIRQDGGLMIYVCNRGQSISAPTQIAGTTPFVVGTPIPFTITITPTTISLTRTDTAQVVSKVDNSFRGNWLAFHSGGGGTELSELAISNS